MPRTRSVPHRSRLHHAPFAPPAARLVLLDALDAAGEPRAALAIVGRRVPVAYPTVAAAIAALRELQGVR